MTAHAVAPGADSRLIPAALLAGVTAAAVAAWVVLIPRMAGMDAGPGGDPGALGWFAATWAVMTAAMMLPASALTVQRRAAAWGAKAPVAAALFLTGYVALWVVAGLAGYAVVMAIRGLHPGALAWSSAGRYVAGAAIVAAGLYQLTALKRRWLERCTTREIPGSRHQGVAGALLAGVEHGGCCVACCWTLMVALYALGMMSVTWMAVLTVLIAGERLLPRPAFALRSVAVVLIALGIAVGAAPTAVPALSIPHTSGAMTMGSGGPMRPASQSNSVGSPGSMR